MRLIVLLLSLLFISSPVFAEEGGGEHGGGESSAGGIQYVEITPKFVVNLLEPKKYLSINVQLLIEGAGVDALIKKHMPAIKHELIMLFSDRSIESLQSMEQREALRQAAVETIHKTINKAEGIEEEALEPAAAAPTTGHAKKDKKKDYSKLPSGGFKDAFFTEFLMQ
jgi:flagellar protein FliL